MSVQFAQQDEPWRVRLEHSLGLQHGSDLHKALWRNPKFTVDTPIEGILTFLEKFETYNVMHGELWARNAETILLNYAILRGVTKAEPMVRLTAVLMRACYYDGAFSMRDKEVKQALLQMGPISRVRRNVEKVLREGIVPGDWKKEKLAYRNALGLCISVAAKGVPIQHYGLIPGLEKRANDPR